MASGGSEKTGEKLKEREMSQWEGKEYRDWGKMWFCRSSLNSIVYGMGSLL